MTEYFLNESDLPRFFKDMHRGPLYGTVIREGRSAFEKLPDEALERLALRVLPPVESLKSFLFPVKERVAVYPSGPDAPEPQAQLTETQPQMIVGLRACDLCALEILEKVFTEGDFTDPFFENRRKCSLFITTDCVEPAENCFCNLVGGEPFPRQGYGLNFSPVTDGYVLSIGTDAGKELVLEKADFFREATPEQLADRDERRHAVVARLKEMNGPFDPRRPLTELAGSLSKLQWNQLASGCVECGACNYVCPTCHCYLLYDQPADEPTGRHERLKTWDSCILANYAKMAGVGGMKATPRPELRGRFENRIRHKFEWMVENLDRLGCVGCGRCSEGCMSGSDVRGVIKELGQ